MVSLPLVSGMRGETSFSLSPCGHAPSAVEVAGMVVRALASEDSGRVEDLVERRRRAVRALALRAKCFSNLFGKI